MGFPAPIALLLASIAAFASPGRAAGPDFSHCTLEIVRAAAAKTELAFHSLPVAKRLKIIEALRPDQYEDFLKTHALELNLDAGPKLPVRLETLFVPGPGKSGGMNQGVFAYSAAPGERRVIKILKLHADGHHDPERLINELTGDYLGESIGAPRIHGFGVIEHVNESGKLVRSDYIEMDEIAGSKGASSLKGGYFAYVYKDRKLLAQTLHAMAMSDPAGVPVTDQIGDLLVGALERGVRPRDPDFLVTAKGEVKWIDTGQWERGAPESLGFDIADLTSNMLKYLASAPNALRRQLFLHLFERIKRSAVFSKGQKLKFLLLMTGDPKIEEFALSAKNLDRLFPRD